MDEQPQGSFCQSCGMPMNTDEDHGTEADGSKSSSYCHYCYQDGAFIDPNATMEQMIEISAKGWSDSDPTTSYEQAVEQMQQIIPQLERWQN